MQARSKGRFASMPLAERLASKINKTDDCWEWTGSKNSNGYGLFLYKGKNRPAHRVVYVLTNGEVPEGLELDHLCRNRACVNPDHLEAVPHSVNVKRGISGQFLEYCKKGLHEMTGDNIYHSVQPSGRPARKCRACHKKRVLARLHNLKLKEIKESE